MACGAALSCVLRAVIIAPDKRVSPQLQFQQQQGQHWQQ
jgi:hypothetical protein